MHVNQHSELDVMLSSAPHRLSIPSPLKPVTTEFHLCHGVGGGLCGCSCWRHFKATQSKGWHLPWWTMVFSVASMAVFMYMAGR